MIRRAISLAVLASVLLVATACETYEANHYAHPGARGYDDSHTDSYQYYYGVNHDHSFYHY